MIPKKIHYCWFGNNPLPKSVKKCIKSWKEQCPEYEIIEWNENNFDVNSHPFMKAAYETKSWAFVSDYARLKVVYDNGGFYLDTDVELIKNLDMLCENQSYFGIEQDGIWIATGLGFGAEKGSDVLREMMNEYDRIMFSKENMSSLTCPVLNTKVLEKYGFVRENKMQKLNGICVYPSEYFDPICPGESDNLLTEKTISIHHYTASWMPLFEKIKRSIVNAVGVERVIKIKRKFHI